jgi:hypothetical protein
MTAEDQPVMELTRNPVDGSHGFICREHGVHRSGLTHQHAVNVEAKHLREEHADPLGLEVDLSAMARFVLDQVDQKTANGAWGAWQALTGVRDVEAAVTLAGELVDRGVRAAVVPF